jgi:hypothetical protein
MLLQVLLPVASLASAWAVPLGSAFNYQGRLLQMGTPADGLYDFRFALFTEGVEGNLCAAPLTNLNVTVR